MHNQFLLKYKSIEEDETSVIIEERKFEIIGEMKQAKLNRNTKRQMNIISLFTGAGGLDIGFKEAGFNCLFAFRHHASG